MFLQAVELILKLFDMFFISLDNFEDGDEETIFGYDFTVDGSMAVRAGDLCFGISFE